MDTVKVKERGMVKFIAHRGLSGIETENTLAAFVAAGNRDYFGVETDVHVTADGHFAILHDDETGRVCDTNIPVEKSEFAQLRALSMKEAGGGYSDVQRIPSLAEYLRVLKRYGKIAVLVDDIIDTAGTITAAAQVLQADGAREVYACASHGVLSGPAIDRINNSVFKSIILTDTISSPEKLSACPKIQVVSIASLLAKTIHNIHIGSSVSALF